MSASDTPTHAMVQSSTSSALSPNQPLEKAVWTTERILSLELRKTLGNMALSLPTSHVTCGASLKPLMLPFPLLRNGSNHIGE